MSLLHVAFLRRTCLLLLVVARAMAALSAGVAFFPSVVAQEQWSSVVTPTTQNLWSVAFGGGRFVAVGENGTALTSSDGVSWAVRAAGTTNWLVGVAYANGQFVAVGDKGVLLTSTDGASWTSRASGTTERLNAVGFGYDVWLAVGENGSAVTSRDGVTWTPIARGGRSTWAFSGWLHGLCFGYGQFVATGERGHIVTTAGAGYFADASVATPVHLEAVTYARHQFVAVGDGLVLTSRDGAAWRGRFGPPGMRALTFFNNTFIAATTDGAIHTSPDAVTWSGRSAALGRPLTAVVANESAAIAVGFRGTILRSSALQAAPVIVAPPLDVTEAAGNHVLLSVTATGTAPLSYQWTYDGAPIAGATSDTLPLRSVTAASAGTYGVTVTNALGTATSRGATLTVIPEFPAVGPISDVSSAAGVLPAGARALLVQPDGKLLVAGRDRVERFTAEGGVDASFAAAAIAGIKPSITTGIEAIGLQADGKILLGGTSNGVSAMLVRLTATGQEDPAFSPPSAFPGPTITGFAQQRDGKMLVANATARLVRLNVDGSIDATFNAADLTPFGGTAGVPAIKRVALTADGKIVVAAAVSNPSDPVGVGMSPSRVLVARLRADGSLDPTFSPTRTGTSEPQLLSVVTDDRVLLGSVDRSGYFGSGVWKVQRLNADGTDDATFTTRIGGIAKYGGEMRAAVDAKGRITVVVSFNNSDPGFQVLRFDREGGIDPTLRAALPIQASIGSPLAAITSNPDGRVWVARARDIFLMSEQNAPAINPPVPFAEAPLPQTIRAGDEVTLTRVVAGTGPFQQVWGAYGSPVAPLEPFYGTTATSVTFSGRNVDQALGGIVTNAAGTLAVAPQLIRVPPLAPALTRPPANVAIERGRSAPIYFNAAGSGPLRYEWWFKGELVAQGEILPWNSTMTAPLATPELWINGMTAEKAGEYELVLTNPLGTVRSATVTVSLAPASRLVDVSSRAMVGAGDRALIAGFTIAGTGQKWILLRGVGPALTAFGVQGALTNPKLILFDAHGAKLEENDDWAGSDYFYTPANWPATFPLVPGSRDALISRSLAPGSYTAQLTGVAGGTGVGLIEVYEGIHDMPRLVNLSSRVFVGAGSEVAISGVVVSGDLPRRVLIRAVGPTLTRFGVTEPLSDPAFTVFNAAGARVAENNDWSSDPRKADVVNAGVAVGAFALPDPSKDAALVLTLTPGSYTVHVRGAAAESGIALIELYELPMAAGDAAPASTDSR